MVNDDVPQIRQRLRQIIKFLEDLLGVYLDHPSGEEVDELSNLLQIVGVDVERKIMDADLLKARIRVLDRQVLALKKELARFTSEIPPGTAE